MRSLPILAVIFAITACQNEPGDAPSNDVESAATDPDIKAAAEGAPVSPSFDCAKADGQAQELVCKDQELAAMDRELARVYALAAKDSGLGEQGAASLRAMQRGWLRGRDECWKGDDLRQCVLTAYASRTWRSGSM